MIADADESQRLRVLDEEAEDPAAPGRVADRALDALADASGEESAERTPIGRQNPQSDVAGAGELLCHLQKAIEHRLHVEFGRQGSSDIEQLPKAMVVEM